MNDTSKLLWAATLIIVGFLAASWLGPPTALPPDQQPKPAGWQTERLKPLVEMAGDDSSSVVQTSGAVPTSGHIATATPAAPSTRQNEPSAWQEPPALAKPLNQSQQFVPSLQPVDIAATTPPAQAAENAAPQFVGRADWWNEPPSGASAIAANRPVLVDPWQANRTPLDTTTASERNRIENEPAKPAQLGPSDRVAAPALLPPDATRATPLAATNDDWNTGFAAGSLTRVDSTAKQPPAPTRDNWQPSFLSTTAATQEERVHIVADGDSLQRLAQRDLGSTDRANDLFAANRDRLTDPRLLPIGVELRIPSSDANGSFASADGLQPQARLNPPRPARPSDGVWP